jgi:plasmid stabilization system protein ParE
VARIAKSLEAERDLSNLFGYIANESGVDRAEMILRRIERSLSRVHSELDGSPRTFSIWPWIVIYEPEPTGDGILVWRIIDGRRDLPKLIRSPGR